MKEGQPVQSTNLCLLCYHLHWHNCSLTSPTKEPGIGPPLDLDADC